MSVDTRPMTSIPPQVTARPSRRLPRADHDSLADRGAGDRICPECHSGAEGCDGTVCHGLDAD